MSRISLAAAVFLALGAVGAAATAQKANNAAAVEEINGQYLDAEGTPTFNVREDGTVDWYTFSGFRRYHAECHVCHGPDGLGSTYAPDLTQSLRRLDYGDFLQVVAGGRQRGGSVMPAFGTNRNVMCYVDDIYVYLRARSEGAVGRGRPARREDKPEAYAEAEDACMG